MDGINKFIKKSESEAFIAVLGNSPIWVKKNTEAPSLTPRSAMEIGDKIDFANIIKTAAKK